MSGQMSGLVDREPIGNRVVAVDVEKEVDAIFLRQVGVARPNTSDIRTAVLRPTPLRRKRTVWSRDGSLC